MTFQLDTSSVVGPFNEAPAFIAWSALTPFAQGYVEALFASLGPPFHKGPGIHTGERPCCFSDLSPEALALILRDCEAARDDLSADDIAREGKTFWRARQLGFCDDFPPLTPTLGDDGKVYLTPKVEGEGSREEGE